MVKRWRLPPLLLAAALLTGCAAPAAESPQPAAAPTPAPATVSTPTPAVEATPTPTPAPDRGDLTEEELGRINRAFSLAELPPDFGKADLEANGFFTSHYADVRELDFREFLWYYPSDGSLEEKDEAEFAALAALPDFPWTAEKEVSIHTIPVPVHRILRSSVDETLKKYAGITTADLKDTGGALYVPEYDAYYTFTSDFGPGSFTCVGGRVEGDVAVLWSEERDIHGNRDLLTLHKEGESWYIQSFLLATVPQNG